MRDIDLFMVHELGSGASISGVYDNREKAEEAAKRLAANEGGRCFIVMQGEVLCGFQTKEPEELASYEVRDLIAKVNQGKNPSPSD